MNPVQCTHLLIAAEMRVIAMCVVSLFVSGCISLNTVRSEDEFSAAPDLSRVCAYAWKTGEVLFRAENVISYKWGAPSAFGYGATLTKVEELTAGCPRPQPERAANLSVYYLEHASKAYGVAVALPMAFLAGFTLGTMPFPFVRNYVACVQATSEDGLNRFAIAEGSITSLENVWGSSDSKKHKGHTETLERRARLMQDLTGQAWHKLWLLQAENLGGEDCRQKLGAIAGRLEPRSPQTDAVAPNVGADRDRQEAVEPRRGPVDIPSDASDAFINCVANGERQWAYRSKCD